MRIVALSTGLSEDSASTKLAGAIAREVARPEDTITHINLRTLASDLASMTVTGFAGKKLAEAMSEVSKADILISTCPTYKGAPIGLHTLFFQLLEDRALDSTVVILGGTGGTSRHSLAVEQLRGVLTYLKAIVTPTAIFAATDDWATDTLHTRITTVAGEALALAGRPKVQESAEYVPLSELLGGPA